jgi:hypothetical protein
MIETADEATADKITGKTYYNTDTKEILVGDETQFSRFKSNSQHVVGDIKTSVLTEAQFQAASGDPTWVLADGRDVSVTNPGSDWESLTGQVNIPDLRGVFLRGKNNARNDGSENPDGDVALGTLQADEIREHTHTSNDAELKNGGYNAPGALQQLWYRNTVQSTTSTTGGDETRPVNVTVNYFIKINE